MSTILGIIGRKKDKREIREREQYKLVREI